MALDKNDWAKKLKEEIIALQKIQHILNLKKPTYPFLFPLVENAIYALANLLAYIEGKNSYVVKFHEGYFYNRQIAMHKAFFSDLHTGVEEGLKKITEEKGFKVDIHKKIQAEQIVQRIKGKIRDTSKITKELDEVKELGGKIPTFNDHLNAVLGNIPSLGKTYIQQSRDYFDGINICRNKVSHPSSKFTESEKNRLKTAKLGKVISNEGDMAMTFEGYKFLINDIIYFFDTLYAHL